MARGPFAQESRNGQERRKARDKKGTHSISNFVEERREGESGRRRDMTRRRAKRALHLPIVALILAACVASAHTAVALDPEAPEDWTLEPWRGNALNSTSSSSVRGHSQMTSEERGREGVAQILTQ